VLDPLVPVPVTLYCPSEPEHDRVELPVAERLVGLKVQERPVAGEISSLRRTVPVKVGE